MFEEGTAPLNPTIQSEKWENVNKKGGKIQIQLQESRAMVPIRRGIGGTNILDMKLGRGEMTK